MSQSHRPISALLGAVTLAALAITTGPPAGAAGDKAPVCPDTPTFIISDDKAIEGTPCDDIVFPGPSTTSVKTFAGDDVVKVAGKDALTTHERLNVLLGDGDDTLSVTRSTKVFGDGGTGVDVMGADWMVPHGTFVGGGGNDRLWSRSADMWLIGDGGDDRLDFTGTGPGTSPTRTPRQLLRGGDGDDVVSTAGATGPGLRIVYEGPGDDTYLVRHKPGNGVDWVLPWFEPGVEPEVGNDDAIVMDPGDVATLEMLAQFESLSVAWGT